MEIKEEWKIIEGYPNYQISNYGNVKSLNFGKEKILKQKMDRNGYFLVGLSKEGKKKHYLVHRIVASAFIPNPNNLPIINHIDEVKTNNCANNLEWCTQKYNINFGTTKERISKTLKGKILHQKPIVQLTKSGLIIGVYESASQVERELNINHTTISKCCNGKRKTCGGFKWKYLDELKNAS